MQIKKLQKSSNAFSYASFEWEKTNPTHLTNKDGQLVPFDSSFQKCNILFGENGNGKSKFVKILKSLSDPEQKIDKHRDLPSEPQEICILLEGGNSTTYKDGAWSDLPLENKVIVFDKDFVDLFVHSPGRHDGDTPQRRQSRGKNIIYLGDFGAYNEEIDRVNAVRELIKKKNDNFSQNEENIVSGILTTSQKSISWLKENRTLVEAIDANQLDSLLIQKTELKKQTFSLLKAKQESQKVSNLRLINKKNESFGFPEEAISGAQERIDPQDLFLFTVTDGIQNVLDKIIGKEDFVSTGMLLLKNEVSPCPFCEQDIDDSTHLQTIHDYKAIFTQEFNNNKDRVQSLLIEYKTSLNSILELNIPRTEVEKVSQAKIFIPSLSELPDITLQEEDKLVIKEEIKIVEHKLENIFVKISETKTIKVREIFETTNRKIFQYNVAVAEINNNVTALQASVNSGDLNNKLTTLQDKLSKLEEKVFLVENEEHFKQFFLHVDQHKKNNEIIDLIEDVYQKMKQEIISKFKIFTKDYFDSINEFLIQINPTMDILEIFGDPTYSRTGREPAQCGFNIYYKGEDQADALSDGERQSIALAYFFAHLDKMPDKDKIIVLDDPITNFDAGKRKSTAELIYKISKVFSQTFILTCDPLFREFCLKMGEVKVYSIYYTSGSSAIHCVPKNIARIHESFEASLGNISSLDGTPENVIIYGQKLRFCLETKIKEVYFGYSEDSLRNMLETAAAQGGAKFQNLLSKKDEIIEIYNYCNTGGLAHYPRDGSTSWAELQAMINRYFALGL